MSDKKDFFSKTFDKNKKTIISEPVTESAVNKTVKEIHGNDIARLTLDIPQELHRRVKIKATELGISIKDYAIGLFEKDLLK
jgi:predicted HicB family RNase H-like nuclease